MLTINYESIGVTLMLLTVKIFFSFSFFPSTHVLIFRNEKLFYSFRLLEFNMNMTMAYNIFSLDVR